MPQNNELKRREISNNTLVYTCFSVPSNKQHSCVHFWPKELTLTYYFDVGLTFFGYTWDIAAVLSKRQLKRNK